MLSSGTVARQPSKEEGQGVDTHPCPGLWITLPCLSPLTQHGLWMLAKNNPGNDELVVGGERESRRALVGRSFGGLQVNQNNQEETLPGRRPGVGWRLAEQARELLQHPTAFSISRGLIQGDHKRSLLTKGLLVQCTHPTLGPNGTGATYRSAFPGRST